MCGHLCVVGARAVTADRGYGEAAVDRDLEALGASRVVIPRRGRPGAARRATQREVVVPQLVNWRAGSEARISCLKRDYGWRRTLTDGETGATTWCSWGVLAHNATKISALALDAERQRAGPTGSARRRAAAA
jgi:transposase, IS5 family